jgi:hypothetical protein
MIALDHSQWAMKCREAAGASGEMARLYLAFHDVPRRVTLLRGTKATEALSSRRPRAQVTGDNEERMGEPRDAEDLRGRPDKA